MVRLCYLVLVVQLSERSKGSRIDRLIRSRQVVDGGDAHTRAPYVPYPEAMFNPKMMTDVLKGKL